MNARGAQAGAAANGASAVLTAQNPWPGLRSFGEADSAYFFGRERETRALLQIVEHAPVTVLYGQSGLGKTSLLHAGLFPPLKAAGHLPVWVRLDHAAAAPPLGEQVLAALSVTFAENGVEAPAPAEGESLWSYFHRYDVDFWGPRNRLVVPVIVLDQFEELFTLGRRDAAASARSEQFVKELEAQFEQRPPAEIRERLERCPEDAVAYDLTRESARFVISLREDYLPHLDALRERVPSMLARRFRLEQMSAAQALEVVRRAGSSVVDDAVAQEIVGFVASRGGEEDGASGVALSIDARVEPAILSVVCDELNLRRLKSGLPHITRELLSGERSQIVGDFYERSFEGIDDSVRDWVEDELLTDSGHRDRAALEDARRAGIDTAPIWDLVDRRVLHSDERNQVVWVEFTHDLLTGPALASRNARGARRTENEAHEREAAVRAKLRRSRTLAAVFGVLLLLMAGALGEAWRKTTEAAKEKERAEEHLKTANEQRQRAEAALARASQQEQAANAAAQFAQDEKRRAETETKRALHAETEATRNLNKAEQTALRLARQSIEELESEWLNPSYASGDVARANVRKIETLLKQFADLPELRVAQRHVLALAAAVSNMRGEEAECSRLARRADALGGRSEPSGGEALLAAATSEFANAQCLQMRGNASEAAQRYRRAEQLAVKLPEGSVNRQRLLVDGKLGRARAEWTRFDEQRARAALGEAEAAMNARSPAPAPRSEEVLASRLAAMDLRAVLASSPREALLRYEQAGALLRGLRRDLRDRPLFRDASIDIETGRANALSQLDRYADAEEVAQRALTRADATLAADPHNIARRIDRDRLRRLRAEILSGWGRKEQALALLREIDASSGDAVQAEPASARARYMLAVSAWLQARYGETGKREQLQRAESALSALVRDAPDHADSVRSLALVRRDLGMFSVETAQAKDVSKDDAQRHWVQADAQFRAALAELGKLRHAGHLRQVADLSAEIEYQVGKVAEAHDDKPAALAAHQRSAALYRAVPVTEQNRIERALAVSGAEKWVARLQRGVDRDAEASRTDVRNLATLERLRKDDPGNFALVDDIAWVHRMAAGTQLQKGQLGDAMSSQLAAAEMMSEAVRRNPFNKQARAQLVAIRDWSVRSAKPAAEKSPNERDRVALRNLLAKSDANQAEPPLEAREPGSGARLPAVAGDWVHVGGQRMAADARLEPEIKRLATDGWTTLRARRLELPFYDDSYLVELDVRNKQGQVGVASFVTDRGGLAFRLDGRSNARGAYNRSHELSLRTEAQARLYLRMFVASLQGDEGMFRLVDSAADMEWSADASAQDLASANRQIEPLEITRADNGEWAALATVQYSNAMFRVKLALPRNGIAEMFDDTAFATDLPLISQRYVHGVRVADDVPNLKTTVGRLEAKKRWAEAARTQQQVIEAMLPRMVGDDAAQARRKTMPRLYLRHSWLLLLARKPAQAVDAAQAGLAIDVDDLSLQTNQAHGLLLSGHDAPAMDLYKRHLGEKIGTTGERRWEDEIMQDLDRLEADGLKDSRFAAVRALMKTGAK